MSRIEEHHDRDRPLGRKHKREEDQNNAEYFLSVARKIGFSEHEIDQLNDLYLAELEEVNYEYRSSI